MTETRAGEADTPSEPEDVLRLTWQEWRSLLERRSFLERDDNRFQTPRQLHGHPVQIVPDDSFR